MLSHAVLSQRPWTGILNLLGLHFLTVKREAVTLPEHSDRKEYAESGLSSPSARENQVERILKGHSHPHGPPPAVCPGQQLA